MFTKLSVFLVLIADLGSPQDDWWYDMGDDWETSNYIQSVNPYYATHQYLQHQMAMYSFAQHVGKINRGEINNPELNMPRDHAYGYQHDFNPEELQSGAFKFQPKGQKFRFSQAHVDLGLASFQGQIEAMPPGTYLQSDGSVLVQTRSGSPCSPNPCKKLAAYMSHPVPDCSVINDFTAKCSGSIVELEDVIADRSVSTDSCWSVYDDADDAVDFTSSSDLLVRGISLFGSNAANTFTGRIELKETDSGVLLASADFSYDADGAKEIYDKIFDSAASIQAGVRYTITLSYDSYYGCVLYFLGNDYAEVTCGDETVDIDFYDSDDDSNGTDEDRGQIPRILFSC